MNDTGRPLAGMLVNLSISENEDNEELGFPRWQVNRTMLQIVSALFSQGAAVVFGHDWRDDGVMEAVHGFALQMQGANSEPLLWNVLPRGDRPRLSKEERERLRDTLRVIETAAPSENDSRGLALSQMREMLTGMSEARICLGGRMRGYQGNMPGVYEEALMAIRAGKPLYLAGLFGGATRMAIDAIERRRHDDLPEWEYVGEVGWKRLEANRLTADENRQLFYTPVLDEAITLILSGLARVRSQR
jgi:hypothetical protein